MPRKRSGYRANHRQSGAALVVGLLMLLVLTVLAIAGTNTSSMSLLVAGNAQYMQIAYQAAETGIERAIRGNDFNPDPTLDPEESEDPRVAYETVSQVQLDGKPQPALPGSSTDDYSTYHFEIDSTGRSLQRGAVSNHLQAVAVIAPADATAGPNEILDEDGNPPASNALE